MKKRQSIVKQHGFAPDVILRKKSIIYIEPLKFNKNRHGAFREFSGIATRLYYRVIMVHTIRDIVSKNLSRR